MILMLTGNSINKLEFNLQFIWNNEQRPTLIKVLYYCKLMLLNADAIWTISNVTKFSLLSHFLRKCSRVEGSSFFGCCQAIRCFSGLRFVSQVSHGEGTGSSGPFLPPPACEHRPCSYETFLLWDSSAVQPVIPEHEDDTHCPAGTAEEPKGYFLAEGI